MIEVVARPRAMNDWGRPSHVTPEVLTALLATLDSGRAIIVPVPTEVSIQSMRDSLRWQLRRPGGKRSTPRVRVRTHKQDGHLVAWVERKR